MVYPYAPLFIGPSAKTYGQGYATLEYLEAAMIDIAWHQLPAAKLPKPDDIMKTEAGFLAKVHAAYAPVPPRYRTPYFLHIFAGGYEAGYSAYIWSEVLARDSGAWFPKHGGLPRAPGDTFRKSILSR